METNSLSLDQMRSNAGEAIALLRTLAHEDRLMLLCQLSEAEMCVSDLESQLHIFQPSLSQQLGVLRREGLVSTRRQGKHIFYRIADDKAMLLLQTLHRIYCQPSAGG